MVVLMLALFNLDCIGFHNKTNNTAAMAINLPSKEYSAINCSDSLIINLTKMFNRGDTTVFWEMLDTLDIYCTKPEICLTDTFYPGIPYFQFKVKSANQLVTILSLDANMNIVSVYLNAKFDIGNYRIDPTCTDIYGKSLPRGLYFNYLRIGKKSEMRKFIC
jgi:hypothetical protein